jgi:murein DD-endopeptidase MepM/ murein hydrolase activator NlpD
MAAQAAVACGGEGGVPGSAASTASATATAGSGGDPGGGGSSSTAGGGCGDVDYLGLCDGDLLVWCERGELMSHDCAADGKTCGWQDDRIGNNCLGAFGYPVGDLTTSPAGGWVVTQVLGHYLDWNGFQGGHLAHDIASPGGESATANAPVHAVADGVVLYAGPNGSSYVNVVLVEHHLGGGETVCSFFGHLGSVTVSEGQAVARGEPIATVLDWQAHFGAANSHLHYVILSADLCAASDAAGGALICGYDDTPGPNGITDLSNEPAVYTSVGDPCGDHMYPDAFRSPAKFIDRHHY